VLEFSVPVLVPEPTRGNLASLVVRKAEEQGDLVLFSRRVGDGWNDVTAARFKEDVDDVARGLVAAGVQPGDRVALMSHTRYEWTVVDFAIWTAGAITVPVYETSSAEQIAWILADSGAVACVVETSGHAADVSSVREQLPALRDVWQIDAGGIAALTRDGAGVAVLRAGRAGHQQRKCGGRGDEAGPAQRGATAGAGAERKQSGHSVRHLSSVLRNGGCPHPS